MTPILPRTPESDIAQRAFAHLASVVRVDSASDERSATIPSTPGQVVLAKQVAEYFAHLGAAIELDEHHNVLATFAGRGSKEHAPPLALLVHLDTARGTAAAEHLTVSPAWRGDRLAFAANERLDVSTITYPSLAEFVGQDVVHGPGDAPFGLDDKLGLAHLMTLAELLQEQPDIQHPPLILVGRPDEEIGCMAAVQGLARTLAARGVRQGYTVDGIAPFEVNVENFNACTASIWFRGEALQLQGGHYWRVKLGGVNTHGATAKAEGHRAATRFASEILSILGETQETRLIEFASDPQRDCDADTLWWTAGRNGEAALRRAVGTIVSSHVPRGASSSVEPNPAPAVMSTAAESMAKFVGSFLQSSPGFVLLAEESDGREGYSHPYRAVIDGSEIRLDIRIRDFDEAALGIRVEHVRANAGERRMTSTPQYINMGPALARHPDLAERALRAAARIGVAGVIRPIRGGTGVDPFLEQGVGIANLGTGYFAPESEKELTTLQGMARHALWLFALVQEDSVG